MHAVIKIIFYIDHIKNADNWVAAILDMQISKCNVISGYDVSHVSSLSHTYKGLKKLYLYINKYGKNICQRK